MNTVGAAGLSGLLGYNSAKDNALQEQRYKKQDQLFDLQMQDRQAQQDADQQRRNYLASLGKVTSPVVGAEPNSADPRKMLSMGFQPEFIKTYLNADNLGKSQIKDYKEVRMPDGSVQIVGFDEYGGQQKTGASPFKAPEFRDLGGQQVAIDPLTMKPVWTAGKTMSPDAAASNAVAWANVNLSKQRLALDQSNQNKPEFKDGQWVAPPRDMKPGETRTVSGGQGVKDANDALALIKQAREILPNATGSYLGLAYDKAAQAFGISPDGAMATAQLQALEGALVSKMPKMSGPQSDKDALLYKQMAGVIGDPTVPVDQKVAALNVIEKIQERYASGAGGTPPVESAPARSPTGLRFMGFE